MIATFLDQQFWFGCSSLKPDFQAESLVKAANQSKKVTSFFKGREQACIYI